MSFSSLGCVACWACVDQASTTRGNVFRVNDQSDRLPIFAIGNLPRPVRTRSKSPTSRIWQPQQAGSIWLLPLICSAARLLGGLRVSRWRRNWCRRLSRTRSRKDDLMAHNSCTTAIGAASIPASLIQQTLRTLGSTCSMSRAGNCNDNAVAERFF